MPTQLAGDPQTQPNVTIRAGETAVGPNKRLEESILFIKGNSNTGVTHR